MHKQQGFALLELLVATLVATLLAIWGAARLADAAHESGAQASAAWMMSVRDGVAAYLDRYADTLHSATQPDALANAGYADWAAPTLGELEADGLLSRGFPKMGPMAVRSSLAGPVNGAATASRGVAPASDRDGAHVRLFKNPDCKGEACRLHAVVYSRHPMLAPNSRQVDGRGIAQWLLSTQGMGGWVNPARPRQLAGASFDWVNPPWRGPALLPGTVALAVGAASIPGAKFIRMHDTRDPEFQGSISVKGPVTASSDVKVGGYLHLRSVPPTLVTCASEGAIALRERGGLVLCRNRQWRSLTGGVAGAFSVDGSHWCHVRGAGHPDRPNSYYVNPHTGNCTCPPGTTAFFMSEGSTEGEGDGNRRIRRYLCLG